MLSRARRIAPLGVWCLMLGPGLAGAGCPDPDGVAQFRMSGAAGVDEVDRAGRHRGHAIFVIDRRTRAGGADQRVTAYEGLFPLELIFGDASAWSQSTTYSPQPDVFFPLVVGRAQRFTITRVARRPGEAPSVRTNEVTWHVVGETRIEIGDCAYDALVVEQVPVRGPFDTPVVLRQVFAPGLGVLATELTFPNGEAPPERQTYDHITNDLTEELP